MASTFSFQINFILYASPKKVFEALTTEKLIKQWSNADASFKLGTGNQYQMFDGWATGEILSFKTNEFISYSWRSKDWDLRTSSSKVSIALTENVAGTKISIEHDGLPNSTVSNKHKEGWISFVLEPLNDFFIDQMEKPAL